MKTFTLKVSVQDESKAIKNRIYAIKCIRTLNQALDLKAGKHLIDGLVDQNITFDMDVTNKFNSYSEANDYKAREYEINSFVNELSRCGFNVDYQHPENFEQIPFTEDMQNPDKATITGLLKEAAILAIRENKFETAGEIIQMLRIK